MSPKQLWLLFIPVLLLIIIPGCYTEWMPIDGIWYCEELQIQIAFSSYGECFAMIDNQKVICDCINDRGSTWFSVVVQQGNVNGHPIGSSIFTAERVELTNDLFIVSQYLTGEEFTFIKIKETLDN